MRRLGFSSVVAVICAHLLVLITCQPSLAYQSSMEWRGLARSVVREASYDLSTHALRLRFASGHEYLYRGVSAECYAGFLSTARKGVYFNRSIRPCYAGERLDRPKGGKG